MKPPNNNTVHLQLWQERVWYRTPGLSLFGQRSAILYYKVHLLVTTPFPREICVLFHFYCNPTPVQNYKTVEEGVGMEVLLHHTVGQNVGHDPTTILQLLLQLSMGHILKYFYACLFD